MHITSNIRGCVYSSSKLDKKNLFKPLKILFFLSLFKLHEFHSSLDISEGLFCLSLWNRPFYYTSMLQPYLGHVFFMFFVFPNTWCLAFAVPSQRVFHFIAWDSTQTGISSAVAKAYFLLSECIDFPWFRNFGYDWYNNLRPYYTLQLIALATATELQQLLSALLHTGNQYSVGCCRGRGFVLGTWNLRMGFGFSIRELKQDLNS